MIFIVFSLQTKRKRNICYMHITCIFFVHYFSKSTIESVEPTCEFLWVLQIQWLILKSDVQKMYRDVQELLFIIKKRCARIIILKKNTIKRREIQELFLRSFYADMTPCF